MKFLVLGGSGLLGSKFVMALLNNGHDVSYTFHKNNLKLPDCQKFELDVADKQKVLEITKEVNPDVVIHTIALKGTDIYETNKTLADKINIVGTKNIIDACKSINSTIVYTSSAFVFDGTKKVFTEEDKPNPINHYGKSKLEVENLVINSTLPFLITRSDQLYGWTLPEQDDNTVTRNLKKLEKGEEVEEISDWYNNPTLADNAVEVILNLIKKEKAGIYHVVGSEFLNRVEWAHKIAEVFGFDKNLIKPKTSDKLNLSAKRPNANLSNEKAQKDSGVKLFTVEEGLKFMLNQLKQS